MRRRYCFLAKDLQQLVDCAQKMIKEKHKDLYYAHRWSIDHLLLTNARTLLVYMRRLSNVHIKINRAQFNRNFIISFEIHFKSDEDEMKFRMQWL